jgi:site-specific DNA recombinase
MTPSHSVKKNADNSRKIYRYYYCTNARRNGHKACRMANIPAIQIEQFVIDQIKGFATDEGVLEEVLQASQKHQKEIIQKLESERRILRREAIEVSDTLQKLLAQKPVDIDCLAAAQERSREIELLSRRIDQKLEATKSTQIERDEAKRVCEEFDSLWETLTTREQARILHLIVERVDFDNEKSTISIALHSNGIESLLSEFNKQKENKAK